jgi:creatinine amidohydrolase/Fe(II)-dependent formamide hydrolase-like protein
MDTEQIKAFDREKTVVLLPVGILEEHGPYLPSFSDGYMAERHTADLADAIVERHGWKVLIFPLIPLGTSPANIIGQKYVFSGSSTVRPSTLRAIFMDLGTDLGEQRFRWVFVVHAHGGLDHNRVLNQAGDYFHDTYGGHMINLRALSLDSNADQTLVASKNNVTITPGQVRQARCFSCGLIWLVPLTRTRAAPGSRSETSRRDRKN